MLSEALYKSASRVKGNEVLKQALLRLAVEYEKGEQMADVGIIEETRSLCSQIFAKLVSIEEKLASGATAAKPPETKAATTSKTKAKVTLAELTAKVQPLVQDEVTKAKVKTMLTELGLNRLGEAKEEQFDAINSKLDEIIAAASTDAEEEELI